MKKIIIIRHAKSDWSNNTSDLDRPISTRGVNDAKIISKIFDSQDLRPEIIYTSIAKRTIETSRIFRERSKFLFNLDCLEVDELYDFSGNGVKSFIKNLNRKLSTVLIFTHNNSCNFLVNDFAFLRYKDLIQSLQASIQTTAPCLIQNNDLVFEF